MPTKQVKPALPDKPATKHKIAGTPKRALQQKPYATIAQSKRTVKRALAK